MKAFIFRGKNGVCNQQQQLITFSIYRQQKALVQNNDVYGNIFTKVVYFLLMESLKPVFLTIQEVSSTFH